MCSILIPSINFVHIWAPTQYLVSSWGTYVQQLDTWYLVGAHKYLVGAHKYLVCAHMCPNLIPSIDLGPVCAATQYQVSSWTTYQLDNWYRVAAHTCPNSILGIELGPVCAPTRYQVSSCVQSGHTCAPTRYSLQLKES